MKCRMSGKHEGNESMLDGGLGLLLFHGVVFGAFICNIVHIHANNQLDIHNTW
jgi:hypothetical protein